MFWRMGHTLLELPDQIYDDLRRRAEQTGKTVEEFAADWLSKGVQGSGEDALLQLAGVVDSELPTSRSGTTTILGKGWHNG